MAMASLVVEMAKTFGTYMLADTASNFVQHPNELMDYGRPINRVLGRATSPKHENWWGTRTEHIVGVAAGLTVTDYASRAAFGAGLRGVYGPAAELTFKAAPKAFLVHTFAFIAAGVALYCGYDAMFNPQHEGHRMKVFQENLYATVEGSMTAWHEPVVAALLMSAVTIAFPEARILGWVAGGLVPAVFAYATVKGFGWDDWGTSGLNDYEKTVNGLQ